MILPSGVDPRGGTVGSGHVQSERCRAGTEGAIAFASSEPSSTSSELGLGGLRGLLASSKVGASALGLECRSCLV